jgi:hypothetical protein
VGGRLRSRGFAVLVLGCLVGGLLLVGSGQGATKFVRVKGKGVAFGTFTPGQVEQIAVRGMPKRGKVQALMGFAGAPGGCSGVFVCVPVQLRRAEGTPRFRTTAKGRALISFVMPSNYERFRLDNLEAPNERVAFVSGQRLLIEIDGIASHGEKQTFGIAVARTTVQIP